MTQLTSICELACQLVQKNLEEKQLEEAQAVKAQNRKPCPNPNDDQSLSVEDVREKIYSNPLFDEEIIPMEIDSHSFNAKSDLIESLPNHDSSVIISSKIDFLFD
nr:hypothetical protein [Tanacetum cinerariifolium]